MYADRDHQPAPELRADRPHPPLADAPSSLLAAFDAAQLAGTGVRELGALLLRGVTASGRVFQRPVYPVGASLGAHWTTMPTVEAAGECS